MCPWQIQQAGGLVTSGPSLGDSFAYSKGQAAFNLLKTLKFRKGLRKADREPQTAQLPAHDKLRPHILRFRVGSRSVALQRPEHRSHISCHATVGDSFHRMNQRLGSVAVPYRRR